MTAVSQLFGEEPTVDPVKDNGSFDLSGYRRPFYMMYD